MKAKILYLLSICLSLTTQSLINRCDEPPAAFPFDPAKFAGKWFAYSTSNAEFTDIGSCLTANFSLNPTLPKLFTENGRFLDKSSDIQSYITNLIIDKWNSGAMKVDGIPETNPILNFFGIKTKSFTFRFVATDYTTYSLGYRCNDDSWLVSVDEWKVEVRKLAEGATAINNIIAARNSSNPHIAELLNSFKKFDHSNPGCVAIADFHKK